MSFLEDFIKSLFSEVTKIRESESYLSYRVEFHVSGFAPKKSNEILSYLSFIQSSDRLVCTVNIGHAEPISYYSQNNNIDEFIQNLSKEIIHQDNEEISLSIEITKQSSEGYYNIYNLDAFIKSLKELTISQFFTVFTRTFDNSEYIFFKVVGSAISLHTRCIYFIGDTENISPESSENRRLDVENFKSVCHYSSTETHRLSPTDFKFNIADESYSELMNVFENYAHILAVIYLIDQTNLIDNQLGYRINGYKTISGSVNLKAKASDSYKEYFDIYKWAYTGGNFIDKIGLARNIISLHFSNSGELELQGHPFQSIQSSFKVYEKQNIKQYIEIRNKISEQLLDFNNRANKIVENFASGFQRSALALISFYISAILIRALSRGESGNIFPLDATILSFAFLAGAFIYFLVSKWEINEQRKRFEDSYSNLKLRYKDLLEEDDIKKILNNDKEFKEDLYFIQRKRSIYSKMWLGFLGILLIATILLYILGNIDKISDALIFRMLFRNPCNC